MSCSRKWQQPLMDAVLGELNDPSRAQFDQHVSECQICAREFSSLRATLNAVDVHMPAKPQAGQLNAWPSVAVALSTNNASSSGYRTWPRFGYAFATAAGFAILVLGIAIGRWMQSVPAPQPGLEMAQTPPAENTSEPVAVAGESPDLRYARFLERSTPLLLAVANHNNERPLTQAVSLETGAEQTLAAELAVQALSLSEELAASGRKREARLVENLEIVFLQIANLPQNNYPDSLNLVQATLEQRAILFQLTVEEMRRSRVEDSPLG